MTKRFVTQKKTTPERFGTFSDGVFAVIITIMVLDLKPPSEATLEALLPLWPTALSYAVSYLFIAIIWVNHHYLFNFCHEATPKLIWWNFAHLFMVSLVPVTTIWMAATRLAAAPVLVYGFVFVLVDVAYVAFPSEALSQASENDVSPQLRRMAKIRSLMTLGMFTVATAVSYWSPFTGLALVSCILLIHLSPHGFLDSPHKALSR
jgi:TMEM175 potassium channel family protein